MVDILYQDNVCISPKTATQGLNTLMELVQEAAYDLAEKEKNEFPAGIKFNFADTLENIWGGRWREMLHVGYKNRTKISTADYFVLVDPTVWALQAYKKFIINFDSEVNGIPKIFYIVDENAWARYKPEPNRQQGLLQNVPSLFQISASDTKIKMSNRIETFNFETEKHSNGHPIARRGYFFPSFNDYTDEYKKNLNTITSPLPLS